MKKLAKPVLFILHPSAFILAAGGAVVVKGQITGSIIGNGLLGLGIAIVVGTWKRSWSPARWNRPPGS
jgi:Ca2+/H+ antiporter